MVLTSFIIAGGALLALTLAQLVAIPSRYIRARLQFSVWLLLSFLVIEVAVTQAIGDVAVLAALRGSSSSSR